MIKVKILLGYAIMFAKIQRIYGWRRYKDNFTFENNFFAKKITFFYLLKNANISSGNQVSNWTMTFQICA